MLRLSFVPPMPTFTTPIENIASTTAVRFEPGDEKAVELVPYGGLRSAYGFNDLVDSWTGDVHTRAINIAKADALGFKNVRH